MQAVLSWLIQNQVVTAMMVVAIIDFVFAVNPATQTSGVLHYILDQLHSLLGSVKPPPAIK